MNKAALFLCILFPFLITGWVSRDIQSAVNSPGDINSLTEKMAAPTPTQEISSTPAETIQPRVLPDVGANAGLVIGASVLVLIIIGGVIFTSRKKRKG